MVKLASDLGGPFVEWAAGRGALTRHLARLGFPVEAVELDDRRIPALRRVVGPQVCIVEGDILRHAPPYGTKTLIANLPFHLTTPALRHLLQQKHWRHAVLLTQWEVARKRAGVGGATMLTAQWWPWFEATLARRIPATAFRPVPSVDAGVLVFSRRRTPLLAHAERHRYQQFVALVFQGRGRSLQDILRRSGVSRPVARRLNEHRPRTLPRDLGPQDWVLAFLDATSTGGGSAAQ